MRERDQQIYQLGRFRLDGAHRMLTNGEGAAVEITPKALDILCVLVENAGTIVSKDELMKAVWPDSFVEEANLSHHIFKLRKALGENEHEKLIETVPKRGYRFVGNAVSLPAETASALLPEVARRPASFYWKAIAGLAVVVVVGIFTFLYLRPPQPAQQAGVSSERIIRSLAVMPFVNESGSEDVEYLADGMTETLIGSLAQNPALGVKPRTAVARYKGKEISAAAAAAELNVQAVLFGRITERAGDITLYLSLVDPATDYQIWGKQYNRKLSDLSALQSEIGRDVAYSLEAHLLGTDETRLAKNYSKNSEAYRLYLLGDYYWGKFTEENFWKAKASYERALEIDPNYALAHSGLSNTYSVLGVNSHISVAEARLRSKAAADRALEIDSQLAEAHVSIGAYKMFFEWDLNGAESSFRRALELKPEYAVPHELLAYAVRAKGRFDEAIQETRRAMEIDPLNLVMIGDLAVCYRFAGRPDEAVRIKQQLLDLDPNFGDAYFEDALARSELGDHETAIKQVAKGLELTGGSTKVRAGVGIVYARAGKRSEAERVIGELLQIAKTRYVSPLDIALIYSAMGEQDESIEWLEKSYEARTPWLFEMNVDPVLAPLRGDPRFQDIARRVGILR